MVHRLLRKPAIPFLEPQAPAPPPPALGEEVRQGWRRSLRPGAAAPWRVLPLLPPPTLVSPCRPLRTQDQPAQVGGAQESWE